MLGEARPGLWREALPALAAEKRFTNPTSSAAEGRQKIAEA